MYYTKTQITCHNILSKHYYIGEIIVAKAAPKTEKGKKPPMPMEEGKKGAKGKKPFPPKK